MKKGGVNQAVIPVVIKGDPGGNRAERRMAKKLERQKGDRTRQSDPGPASGITTQR